MSFYQKNVHKNVKERWNNIRNDITDIQAISIGDEITNNPRPTWNQFATYLYLLETIKSSTPTMENSDFQVQN